jgi:hypothetical protein
VLSVGLSRLLVVVAWLLLLRSVSVAIWSYLTLMLLLLCCGIGRRGLIGLMMLCSLRMIGIVCVTLARLIS